MTWTFSPDSHTFDGVLTFRYYETTEYIIHRIKIANEASDKLPSWAAMAPGRCQILLHSERYKETRKFN